MQIDFHHAVTYVAARIAGFKHEEADIIAYAAQYVDDATCNGAVCFDNDAMYLRISSAHKLFDKENFDEVENRQVWLPFHFLPGNGGQSAGGKTEGTFINKLVCLPNSPVALEMVRAAILGQDKSYHLHRLGITMHVYADTWAHQGFAGVQHDINNVEDAEETDGSGVFGKLITFLLDVLDKAVPPLGHGRANVLPDMPFLAWQFKNGRGETISRDNTDLFCTAADAICRRMQEYRRHGGATVEITGIGTDDMQIIRELFSSIRKKEGEKRHWEWVQAIKKGRFSFGGASISYDEDEEKSWKAQALGTADDLPEYPYNESFLASNWKMFHDALQLHRLTVSHEILPRYGICAA